MLDNTLGAQTAEYLWVPQPRDASSIDESLRWPCGAEDREPFLLLRWG